MTDSVSRKGRKSVFSTKQHQNFSWPVKTVGADYYPEQWDRALWKSDYLPRSLK